MSIEEKMPASHSRFDGLSCAGLLLIFTMMAAVVVAAFRQNRQAEATAIQPTSTSAQLAIWIISPSPTPTEMSMVIEPSRTATVTPLPPTATKLRLPPLTNTITSSPQPTISPSPFPTHEPTIQLPPPTIPTLTPIPLPTLAYRRGITVRVPILMYHYISVPPAEADKYRRDLSVRPQIFAEQMAFLTNNGYTTLDLYDLSLINAGKQDLPSKPVILTFDDGYLDFYDNAFPILQQYQHKATLFVVTDFLNQQLPQYISWPMVVEMANAGIRIEPHSVNHPDLTNGDYEMWQRQIQGSQQELEPYLGYLPRYFAYPSGRYNDKIMAAMDGFGIWGAVTTAGGWWHGHFDRYQWSRLRMRNTTTLNDFAWLLNNGLGD